VRVAAVGQPLGGDVDEGAAQDGELAPAGEPAAVAVDLGVDVVPGLGPDGPVERGAGQGQLLVGLRGRGAAASSGRAGTGPGGVQPQPELPQRRAGLIPRDRLREQVQAIPTGSREAHVPGLGRRRADRDDAQGGPHSLGTAGRIADMTGTHLRAR
jgi:hypothetical protein